MHLITGLLAVLMLSAPVSTAPAFDSDRAIEEHCVFQVVNQSVGGQFVLSDPTCFHSLRDAMTYAASGSVTGEELLGVSGPQLFAEPSSGQALSTFTLGIHFDGTNGSGSSISVVGSSCTGGWWNTGGTWANRISSSWNGCFRLRHYDLPNKSGTWADTTEVGQIDNIPSAMNNRTESVAYFGS
jgi:hypothetical protein